MSWLKFNTDTPEKPEVLAITIAMGWDDPDLTVGKLLKVWRWFDAHSIDGNARGVTKALLERLLGVTGLLSAMEAVGWLEVSDEGLTLPNFDRHNGKTAKDRALTAKRVAEHKGKAKSNAPANDEVTQAPLPSALPREEKRREEEITEPIGSVLGAAKAARASKKAPSTFELTAELRAFAEQTAPHLSAEAEFAKFRDHTFATARTDWAGTWRNWVRKAAEQQRAKAVHTTASERRVLEAAPGIAAAHLLPAAPWTTIDMEPTNATPIRLG